MSATSGWGTGRVAQRDRFVDLLKVLGLLAVVLGHWLAVYLEPSRDGMRGGNILALDPWLWPITWLIQVMPLFFVAGGAANAYAARAAARRGETYADFVVRRLVRLLRPVLVLLTVWVGVLLALHGLGVAIAYPNVLGRLVGQPLWFLAVYVVVVALVPVTLAVHRRWPVLAVLGLLSAVVAVDVARLALGWAAAGFANLALVWVLLHQFGYWYADGRLHTASRRTYLVSALAGLAVLAALVAGPYPASMVGLPGAPVSNMNPPTVCIVVLGAVQLLVALLARRRVTKWLECDRPWRLIGTAGSVAMPVYLWHLSAVALVGGVLLVSGVPLPRPGGTAWWLLRPAWLAGCAVALVPIVMAAIWLEAALARVPVAGRLLSRSRSRSPGRGAAGRRRTGLAVLAVVLASLGLFGLVVAGVDPLDESGGRLITLYVTVPQSLTAVLVAWLLTMGIGYLDIERPSATEAPGRLT